LTCPEILAAIGAPYTVLLVQARGGDYDDDNDDDEN